MKTIKERCGVEDVFTGQYERVFPSERWLLDENERAEEG